MYSCALNQMQPHVHSIHVHVCTYLFFICQELNNVIVPWYTSDCLNLILYRTQLGLSVQHLHSNLGTCFLHVHEPQRGGEGYGEKTKGVEDKRREKEWIREKLKTEKEDINLIRIELHGLACAIAMHCYSLWVLIDF